MVSLYDVEQLVRKILASASAAVSAQQDGTVVSDGYRSFNFQGAGVVASADPAARRVNVNIPGSPTASSTTTVVSDATMKALSLWTGSTNNAPPANWQTPAFSDAGWSASVVATNQAGWGISGTSGRWASASPASNTEQALFRQTFSLPAGSISSATLTLQVDDVFEAIYVNGVSYLPGAVTPTVLTLSPSQLVAGGNNLIAIWAQNQFPTNAYTGWRLEVVYTSAAVDTRYIPYSLIDAKGDLIVGTADNAASRFAVGTDGLYLRAHSAAATGVDWSAAGIGTFIVEELDGTPAVTATALKMPNGTLTDNGDGTVTYTPAAAGSTLLFESVLGSSAASISTGTLPTGHKGLRIVFDGRSDASTTDVPLGLQFNGDTAANYDSYGLLQRSGASANIGGAGITSAQVLDIPAATATANFSGGGVITIPNYEGTTFQKEVSAYGALRYASNTGSTYAVLGGGFWRSTAAITSIVFLPGSGNFVAGTSVRVYAEGS